METFFKMKIDVYLPLVVLSSLAVSATDLSKCQPIIHKLKKFTASHGDYCYAFVNDEVYWTAARTYCWENGGDMLEIDDEATMQFIRVTLNSKDLGWTKNGVWLGAHDRHKEGQWLWSSNRRVGYSDWARGQPSSFVPGTGISFEDCACMRKDDNWKWHDYPCELLNWKYNFICQFRMMTTTTTSTTTTTTTTPVPTTTTARPTADPSTAYTSRTVEMKSVYTVLGDRMDFSPSVVHGMLSRRKGNLQHGEHLPPAFNKGSAIEYHSGALDPADSNKGSVIGICVGSICFLLLLLCILFFVYRRRQTKKPNREDEPPQFENLSYAQLRQADVEGGETDAMCFTANQMNSLYEEVSKPVNHGVNYYANMNGGAACAEATLSPKVTNIEAAKENNATSEKVVDKPVQVKIVNNKLYDMENPPEGATSAEVDSAVHEKQDEEHHYEDLN